jgi:hypothetical protein
MVGDYAPSYTLEMPVNTRAFRHTLSGVLIALAIGLSLLSIPTPDSAPTDSRIGPLAIPGTNVNLHRVLFIVDGPARSFLRVRYSGGRFELLNRTNATHARQSDWGPSWPPGITASFPIQNTGYLNWSWKTAGFDYANIPFPAGFFAVIPLWPFALLAGLAVLLQHRSVQRRD